MMNTVFTGRSTFCNVELIPNAKGLRYPLECMHPTLDHLKVG